MSVEILNESSDEVVDALAAALGRMDGDRPRARVQIRRVSPVTVWIRVIDPDLAAVDEWDRVGVVWDYLRQLPDPISGHVGMTVPVTPEEVAADPNSLDFEDALSGDSALLAA